MHPVGACGERHVGAIIDDERDPKRRQRSLDSTGLVYETPGRRVLVAQLDERCAALRDPLREIGKLRTPGTVRVDKRVEAKVHHGGSSDWLAASRAHWAPCSCLVKIA